MPRSLISVIVPAYNEEETIRDVIRNTVSAMESLKHPFEIIIVDDGSTDKTRLAVAESSAMLVSNGTNRGKGHALRKGFQHARGDIIVTLDADGAHTPRQISKLLKPVFNGVDVVAGSRFLDHGNDATSTLNRLGNFIINVTIWLLTGKHITDSQTGFRVIRTQVLNELNLESLGFEIETEITMKGLKNGFVYQEEPIRCHKRTHSVSKLRILPDGLTILKTIFKTNFMHN